MPFRVARVAAIALLSTIAAFPAHASRATRAAVESDPHFAAWAAALEAAATAPSPGCATTETLGAEQLERHRLREELLASLAARGIEPGPAPGGGPWPWGIAAGATPVPALVDSGDVALLVDNGMITYLNREGDPEVDPYHAAQAFYAGHDDEYDFLVIFTNFASKLAGGRFLAYHQAVANDITGLGYTWVRSDELFSDDLQYTRKSTPGRLQSLVHLNDIRMYPDDPYELFNGWYSSVTVLGHEIGHRWLARVRLEYPGIGPSLILLGRQSSHWSFFFDSGGSALEGNDWDYDGNSFGTLDTPRTYGVLDLYLMGMMPASEVPAGSLWYVNDPQNLDPPFDAAGGTWGRGSAPTPAVACTGDRVEFSVQDLTLTNGLRLPAYPDAPRDFRVAFALIVEDLSTVTPEQLGRLAALQTAFRDWFAAQTLGRGSVDTGLHRVPARVVFAHHAHGDVEDASSPIPFETGVRLEQWSLPTQLEDIDVALWWSVDDGPFTETAMSSSSPGTYATTIPPQPLGSTLHYYLRATSRFPGHESRLPQSAPDSTYTFHVRPDVNAPSIVHAGRASWSRFAEPPRLRALVRDLHGVESVWIESRVQGTTTSTVTPMQELGTTDLYEARLVLPGRLGDIVEYRILARDIAATPFVSVWPASGWQNIELTGSLYEGAETEDLMWEHHSLRYDGPDQWHREIVNPISGLYSWKIGPSNNLVPGIIAPRQDAVLVSPAIDVFPGGKMAIVHRFAFLPDEFIAGTAIDGGLVQWQDVDRDGPIDKWWLLDPDLGYTHYLSYETDAPLHGWPCFSGTEPLPIDDTFTFPPWVVNRTIRLRFRVVTASPLPLWPARDGWVIDDITIDPGSPPTPVTLQAVTAVRGDTDVRIGWTAVDVAAGDRFVVTRTETADESGAPEEIARVEADPGERQYSVVDTGAHADRDYRYRVGLWSGGVEVAFREAQLAGVRRFALLPNVPNPFNPTTRIAFEIPERGRASLVIHDVRGRRVRTLVDGTFAAGRHDIVWDGTDAQGAGVASGIYLLRLESGGRSSVRRMVLLR